MKKYTWTYVEKATQSQKLEMQAMVKAENDFQQKEPHGWDENDNDCPITFKLEKHNGYQMQAYTPSGNMMNGFHESFIRCGNCKEIGTHAGGSDEQFCGACLTELPEYGW